MAFNTNNNNQNQITNTTYTPISFANSESTIDATRFNISYFNKLMKISIAKRNNVGSADAYATYDNDNAVSVYVSYTKAKILHDLMVEMKDNKKMNNVCIELNSGLFKVSNGMEFGVNSPCFSISLGDQAGNITETVYQTKADYYQGAYNFKDGKFSTKSFENMEYDIFLMVLEQYYIASSYAIAATVMEASMYKRNTQYSLIRAIADKIGVQTATGGGNNNSRNYNSMTFLANNSSPGGNNYNQNRDSNGMSGASEEYESSTFADIASSMGLE